MNNKVFTNVRTERLYEKIVKQIQDLIQNGQLQPGDRLPGERELAKTLGCSRTSLREAFRVLESEGLIISKAGGGRFVQRLNRNISLEYTFNSIDIIEKSAILAFLEAREILEPKIVELACERATKEDIEKMEKAIQKMEESLKYPEKEVEGDSNFHIALAEATDNFVIVSMMETNLNMIRQVRKKTLVSMERYNESLTEHKEILEAVKNKDIELAIEKTLVHLDKLRKSVLNYEKK